MTGALSLFLIPYLIPDYVIKEKMELKRLLKYNIESNKGTDENIKIDEKQARKLELKET